MPRFSLEDVDEFMDYAEKGAALTSLGATGATLVAPNPVTGVVAIGSNVLGAGIDIYQGIRAAINGDYGNAAKNAGELLLSIFGAKAINSANRLSKTDKALDAAGATRQLVKKTVGRGRGKHKIVIPVERDKAYRYYGAGFGASIGGNASSFGSYETNGRYIAPSDNTRLSTVPPLNFKHGAVKMK